MTYAKHQDRSDAFDWERWFADHRLFRDLRFDGQKWTGPAAGVARIAALVGAPDED